MTARRVLETIIFADLLDHPLTLLEIARLVPDASLRDIDRCLQTENRTLITAERGFFVCKGREHLVHLRKLRETIGDRKLQHTRTVARMFRHIPGVRAIAVCNSASWRGGKDESDIDFFIMTRPGFLWTARLFAILLADWFFARPRKGATRDALCLSFYATTDFHDLREIAIGPHDRYLAFWRAHLHPLYDPAGLLQRFHAKVPSPRWEVSWSFLQPFWRVLFFWLEPIARALEMRFFPSAIKNLMNRDTRVVVNNRILKFYTTDRREELEQRFQTAWAHIS